MCAAMVEMSLATKCGLEFSILGASELDWLKAEYGDMETPLNRYLFFYDCEQAS